MSHQPTAAEMIRQNSTIRIVDLNVAITDQAHIVSRHSSLKEAEVALRKFKGHREMVAKSLGKK